MEVRRGSDTRIFGGNIGDSFGSAISGDEGDGEPVVVSVGILPLEKSQSGKDPTKGRIFPNDKFTLDIFVFNKSSWMRRFEVTYPDARASRKSGGQMGIIPLTNRIRVG
jgi:hypothetical protein